MSEWKEYKFSDFVDINPTVKLPKGENVPFVEMKDLDSNNRWCTSLQNRTLSGGSRFHNNDTLFARISPCFENGKICQVRNLSGGVGFGSTEFHVMRGLDGISDTDFVFYLCRWEEVKAHAYLHLEGSSGRQRVPKEAFDSLILSLPPIEEQRRIAGVLGALDEKIDLLSRENATLEALAETLFRHYFIENPNPDWKEGRVSMFADHNKESINPQKHPDKEFLHYSIPAYDMGQCPTVELGSEIQSNKYIIPQNCILFSKLNPHKDKRVWLMLDGVQPNAICSTEFQIAKPKNDKWLYFLYGWLTYKDNYDEIASGVSGTSGSHQRIDPKVIFDNECPMVDDETIVQNNKQVKPLFEKIKTNQQQILTLSAQRDTLLPRLMSGEVKVGE